MCLHPVPAAGSQSEGTGLKTCARHQRGPCTQPPACRKRQQQQWSNSINSQRAQDLPRQCHGRGCTIIVLQPKKTRLIAGYTQHHAALQATKHALCTCVSPSAVYLAQRQWPCVDDGAFTHRQGLNVTCCCQVAGQRQQHVEGTAGEQ